ncbi:MAG: hypothetical protein IKY59_03585 [Oscillospiraceae bacterium]|nr:hypothetical protein [Oscillospiraceae bacterium]
MFCFGKDGICRYLFNKRSSAKRINEIRQELKQFNWLPSFANWYDIKGDKEWWAFCFPQLKEVSNADAWAKIPLPMLEYIKGLPEFDEKVWSDITK